MSLASLDWGRAASGGRKRSFGGFVVDWPLLLIVCAIVSLGMVVLYSAVSADTGLLLRQGMRFGVGLVAFFVLAQIPPHYLRIFTPWIYLLGVGLLLAVAVEGKISMGAQRWLDLGFVRFQPSELLKLAVPMMCAWFMHERRLPPTFAQLCVMGLIVLTPALLIAEQPDLGTACSRSCSPVSASASCCSSARSASLRYRCCGRSCATTRRRACSRS
jgi:rod shape determining protein RodA